ncbi:hypothetical protein F2Q68_00034166 [Brassica cretica]|uniref:Uncharacterized protein n=1 Tax=Brassica cretica TaxID=69181 RepID=A0A8S9GZG0_BRACR|nr:hypothetical protein F2Q68_00034166 [Brassica cretica]
MTHSFLERIGQPEVDLANHREESVSFNVHDDTSIPEFSSSQMFSMLFRDLLGTTETERNSLASATSRDAEDLLFFRMPRFVLEVFAGLKMFRDVARV